jgi:PTS system mannose-specific IIA component
MPALFIIAHAPLASALRSAARHVFPEVVDGLAAYDVRPEASESQTEHEAAHALAALGEREVLVLTDVFGATPCNIASRLVAGREMRVAVGVNVPMLWRSITYRHKPLDELLALALAGARMGVMQVADSRPQNQAQKNGGHDQDDRNDQQ